MLLARGLALLLLALAVACGDQVQYADPPERVTGEGSKTTRDLGQGSPHGDGEIASHGRPSEDPFADPQDEGKALRERDEDPDQPVFAGTVMLSGEQAIPQGSTIYICAGSSAAGGAPIFSRQYVAPSFPLDFELTPEHKLFGDTAVNRPLYLYAIVSEAGPVGARRGLYFKTEATDPTPAGTDGVQIVLKKRGS